MPKPFKGIIFIKHKELEYESEVRILCKLRKNLFDVPFTFYKFDPEALICVLLGERVGYEERLTIKNILRLEEYKQVNLFKKERDHDNPRSYKYIIQQP